MIVNHDGIVPFTKQHLTRLVVVPVEHHVARFHMSEQSPNHTRDLFFIVNGRRYGVEVKFSEAPAITRSMRTALDDLSLDHLWIVYPGRHRYPVDERITAWPLERIGELSEALRLDGRSRKKKPRAT